MTEYQLRKSFVEIFIYDPTETLIGETKVNLFLISSGPYHQNFSIALKKGSNTRIYFDMKISQIIQIELDSIQLQIDLVTKHPGQKFNYSIKPIVILYSMQVGHHQELNSSQRSYTVKVKLDDKQNIEQKNEEYELTTLQRKITIKNAQKLIPQGHNLVWTKQDYLPMPSIVMKTLVSDLHHCYFQIIFWKINDKTSTKQQQMSQLFAQCFVALHKIFDIQPTPVSSQQGPQQKRIFESQDKLWHNGQEIGKGKFKFQVLSDKYIKQMQVMVRTEQGIVKYSPVFFTNSQKSQSSACPQLQQLLKIQQQIQQSAIQLDRVQTQGSQIPSIQSRKIKVSIEQNLQRLLNLLQKSSQTNIILYNYSSSLEMMKAQELFLNLGFKTMGYLEEQDFHINDLCWEILTAIMARGQFMLVYVGFDQVQRNKILQNKLDKKLQRRIDIALTYHQFMSKMLRIAVNSLSVQGLEMQKSFAEIFCAYAYFRIQNFRNTILQVFTRKNDPQLPEWRGIQFALQHDVDYDELKQQVNTFTALFDWPNNFHKCIQSHQKYQTANNEIHQILVRQDWKFRLAKRSITFFQFVKCWVQYVESIVVKSKDIQWKYFPGYNKLLKCFLCEMKKRSILEYPDILKAKEQKRTPCKIFVTDTRIVIIRQGEKRSNIGIVWIMIRRIQYSAESDVLKGIRIHCRGLMGSRVLFLYGANSGLTNKLYYELKSFCEIYNKTPTLGFSYETQKLNQQKPKLQVPQIQQFETTKVNLGRRKNAYASSGETGNIQHTTFNNEIGLMMQELPEGVEIADLWEILR